MSEIKINELTSYLKTAAENADLNKDKTLKGDEEISAFIKSADKLVEAGLVDENYKETLGLTLTTNPNQEYSVQKNEVKLNSSKLNKQEKKLFKSALKSARTIEEVNNIINEKFSGVQYAEAKKVATMFINDIKEMNINSKEDVEKIVKLIDKKYDNCDGFEKDIAKILADITKGEQINKEKNNLLALYNDLKGQNPDKTFSEYVELVKDNMEKNKLVGSYYKDEAFKGFLAELKKEANLYLDTDLRETGGHLGRTFGDTKRQVRKELQATAGDDQFLKDVIKKDKTDNILEARYNKFRATTEVLKDTTAEMLKSELKDSVLAKLSASYIDKFKNEKGNYNLTELQAQIAEIVGDDLNLNRSQNTEIAELKHVKDKLKELTGADFSTKEVKDLIEFLGLNYEKRDRSIKTVLKNMVPGAVGGGVAGGANAGRLNIDATQSIIIKMDAEIADSILKTLGPNATATTLADGSIAVKMIQNLSVIVDKTLIGALAGVAEGALINALTTLIVGEDKPFEKACFSMTYLTDLLNKNENLEEIQENICKKYPGMKGSILAALAKKAYDKAEGKENWKMDYLGNLSKIAGVGSNPNCEELNGNKFTNRTETRPEGVNAPPAEEHVYDTKETPEVKPEYEEVPTIDARRSSWSKLSEQYECLEDIDTAGLPLCTKRKAQLPVRILKIAQAITDGNYSLDRMLKLAEMTFASPNNKYENLKGIEGIDHAVLVNIMKADWLSASVKMPKQLAGCNRNENISIIAPRARRGGSNAPVASAGDRIQTKAGQGAKYYASFDNGAWVEYPSAKARDNAVADFKKKHPNAKVSKKND